MAGIYIHIPFCKQACHYCDFHFSTSFKRKNEIVKAICLELCLRKTELKEPVETIYFGGGTPSVLSVNELQQILSAVNKNFSVKNDAEITLEANPDDLMSTYNSIEDLLMSYKSIGINRLSIGIQSFFDHHLDLMNRAHNSEEAEHCLSVASKYFDNITADLIYGIPGMTENQWRTNISKLLEYNINHVSSYALTVEPKTALEKLINKGKIESLRDEISEQHFSILVEELEANNFIHYELSNFGKPNYFSKHNTSYWLGKWYIGIGPSAHSFYGNKRSWNVANNIKYLSSIFNNELPSDYEVLEVKDCYNEYVMTGLRTMFGVSIDYVEKQFGKQFKTYLLNASNRFIQNNLLELVNHPKSGQLLKTTKEGKFLCDGIASDLFITS